MVGGNGPNVTWRLAARLADELNVDGLEPDEVAEALPVIRSRCEEIGRDPATLALSVHVWKSDFGVAGARRVDRLAGYRELGVSRVMGLDGACTTSDEALESLRADAEEAGVELAGPAALVRDEPLALRIAGPIWSPPARASSARSASRRRPSRHRGSDGRPRAPG